MAGQENSYDEYVPYQSFRVMCPVEFDLSGTTQVAPIFVPKNLPLEWGNVNDIRILVIKKWWITYSEASSADAGVDIYIGTPANDIQYDVVTTLANQAIWTTTEIPQSSLNNVHVNNTSADVLLVTNIGGKTGAGKVYVTLEFSYMATDDIQ